LAAVLGVAVVAKAWALWHGGVDIDADEAIVGMMAQSMLQGRFTLFYWGQDYMAPVESLVLAPLLAVLGSHGACLRGLALLFFLAFLHSTYLLGKRTVGPRAALVATLLLAVSPLFLHIWGLKLRGGFVSLCAAGQYLLCAVVDRSSSPVGPRSPGRWALLCGLAMGVMLYWYFLAVEFVLPCLLLLARSSPVRTWRWRQVGLGLLGFAAGFSPVMVYNLQADHRFSSFTYFADNKLEGGQAFLDNGGRLLRSGLPILAGVMGPWTKEVPFSSWVEVLVAVVLLGAVGVGTVWLAAKSAVAALRWARLRPWGCAGYTPLGMVALACVGAFTLTKFGEWVEPRFLIPLYAPLWLALADVVTRLPMVRGVVVAVLLGVTTVGAARSNGVSWHQPVHRAEIARPFPSPPGFARYLEERHLRGIYGDYWFCKPMLFATQSRLACHDQYARTPWMKPRVYARASVEKVFLEDEGRQKVRELTDILDGLRLRYDRSTRDGIVLTYGLRQGPEVVPYRDVTLSSPENPGELGLATDVDPETRWTTRRRQGDGPFRLEVALAAPRRVQEVALCSHRSDDHPRHLTVEGSLDGQTWVGLGTAKQEARPATGVQVVGLKRAWVTRLRLTAEKADKVDSWWSVHEITLVDDDLTTP
jgi:hypothetical protein